MRYVIATTFFSGSPDVDLVSISLNDEGIAQTLSTEFLWHDTDRDIGF